MLANHQDRYTDLVNAPHRQVCIALLVTSRHDMTDTAALYVATAVGRGKLVALRKKGMDVLDVMEHACGEMPG